MAIISNEALRAFMEGVDATRNGDDISGNEIAATPVPSTPPLSMTMAPQ